MSPDGDTTGGRAPSGAMALALIHTNNSPKRVSMRVSSPLAGLFRHPSGTWTSVQRFASGQPWGRSLGVVSRQTVMGGAYAAKSTR